MPDTTVAVTTGPDDGQVIDVLDFYFDSGTLLDVGLIPVADNPGHIWIRFQNVAIPPEVAIDSAFLTLYSGSTSGTGQTDIDIYGNLAASATNPSSYADFNAKTRTAAKVDWAISAGAVSTGDAYPSVDIGTVIQEIVNQGGWSSGNDLMLFLQNDAGNVSGDFREFMSYENTPAKAASLTISYSQSNLNQVTSLEFYLIPHQPDTVFTARVDAAPTDADNYTTITYNTGVTGSFGDPIAGQTVWFGSSSGGQEVGLLRLKDFSAGSITVAESDDVGPQIQVNDYITIKNEFRLWPKYPRFVQAGASVTIFEDYDIAYTTQLNLWKPVAAAGPPGVAFLEGGQAQINFVGDQSFAVASGASLSSYLWTAQGSSEGTSSSQGTTASPVVFTWTTPGWHRVSLQVTDSNSQTHTNYTWAVVIDPADPTGVAFLDFDPISDSFDFEQGGGKCGFMVRGDISISQFPEGSMVLHVARGTQTTATGSWPHRTNLLFNGWILGDTVRQNPTQGDVQFRAGTIDSVMRNLSMFPVSLLDVAGTPVSWIQAKNLDVDRACSFIWEWRSTLASMTSIKKSGYAGLLRRQDFGPTDLYAMISNLMASIWGKVVSSTQSVLYHQIDYNLQNATERATVTTRKLLHKGLWLNDVSIDERSNYEWPASQVKMSGIYYPGGQVEDICPLFSEAPGDAPKVYGKETNFDRLILLSQSDLNVRSGHALAKINEQYPIYRMEFINDGSYNPVPQELFPVTIEASDNDRGLAKSINLIPRRVNRTYSHAGGYFIVTVDFEPETSGNPGVTVSLPCGPPEQVLPPSNREATPEAAPGLTSLIASTTGSSFYFAPGVQQTWERRVNGLLDPDQISMHAIGADPWSAFKQGGGAENTIVWGTGEGFLVRSEDAGRNWGSRSPYLEQPSAPAWPGETGTALASIDIVDFQQSIFSENQIFVLASWQYTGAWHSAIGKSEDGFTFVWHNLTGSAETRGLGIGMDKGNGQDLYTTSWESEGAGGLYLRAFNLSAMTLNRRVLLGAATETQVGSQSLYAYPFTRNNQAGEVFVFGRMTSPQSFTGSTHILLNTANGATGSWSVVENTWGTDIAGSFGVDSDGNYYAVRQG